MRLCILAIAAILAGCGGPAPPPSTLRPAPSWCMSGPQKLPQLFPGENLVEKHAGLRRQYAREAEKLRCAQSYIRTARGK
jgi:hypothetical protein